jgi:intracellular sulfur oxidation DsrE/DsrF family protein
MQMAAGRCQAAQLMVKWNYYGRHMMIKFENVFRTSAAVLVALLIVAPPAAAQVKKQQATQMSKRPAAVKKLHRVILQVNTNEPAIMNLALNNATNVAQYYKDRGAKVTIEVITFGPGLHMLRSDTSPVKARIETLALSTPEISFKACGNTQQNMQKAENKDIPLIPQAQVVDSGVVRVMELQEQGWTYVKP